MAFLLFARDLARLGTIPEDARANEKIGFIPLPTDETCNRFTHLHQSPPIRSDKVLAKFGVKVPKPPSQLPRIVNIGSWRRDGREIHFDRAQLFDRVSSEPVEKLATEWGLPGRGLAKVMSSSHVFSPASRFLGKEPA